MLIPAPRRRTETGEAQPLARNVTVLSATTGLIVMVLYTWYPLLPIVLERRGASTVEVSLTYTVITLASGILQMYGGRLADRFGRKPLLAVPTYFAALMYLGVWLSHSWLVLAASLCVLNITGALQGPSFVAMTAESVPSHRRPQAFATFQFAAGLATVIGPALGALLLNFMPVEPLMAATAAASLVAAVMRSTLLREVPATTAARSVRLLDAVRGRLGQATLASTLFLLLLSLTASGPFIALFAHLRGGLPSVDLNLLFAFGWLPGVLLSFWLGRHISSFGSARALSIGVVGHLALLILWLFVRGFWPMVILLSLSLLCLQMATIAYGTLRVEGAGAAGAGSALGAMGTVSTVGAAFGPLLGGWASTAFGLYGPFGLAVLVGLATVLVLRRWQRPE